MADAKSPFARGCQRLLTIPAILLQALPLSRLPVLLRAATNRSAADGTAGPASGVGGMRPGRTSLACRRRHLRTLALHSAAMTIGGSNVRSREWPRSVTISVDEGICQLMRLSVARSAVHGPVTKLHCEEAACWSLMAAAAKASASCDLGSQLSHTAVAHCLAGATCASKAGSKVPVLPSRASKTRTGFFPAADGEAAAAILDLAALRPVSEMPKVSQP